MIDNPILDAMESGNYSRENWTVWACQRYHAAHGFIRLLEIWITWARSSWLIKLQAALQENLDDENGMNNPQLGPHEKWRQNFYNALGVRQEQLEKWILLPWTNEYWEVLESLEKSSIHGLIGALLYLEFSIPHEFRRIQIWRDTTFREKFVIEASDSKEAKKEKWLARMYLDHHIIHDSDSHFPNLVKSIEPLLEKGYEEKIIGWVMIIAQAKKQFYACLPRELLGTDTQIV